MTDYTVNEDYTGKDALLAADPEKLILGSDIDSELDEIATAIATKFDTSDIATEAQAEAGVSTTTLITPALLGNYTAPAGSAGVIEDIIVLVDPEGDRIIFWDESANTAVWLSIGTGLTITDTTLHSDDPNIDHDALNNFVANEHIDMSGVTITAGSGLSYSSGGTDLTASATIDLDINELTALTDFDFALDYLPLYDASATANKKATLGDVLGDVLGDGLWYVASNQAISAATETTIVYDTEVYDELKRGTFSTVTGIYTAGAEACRIHVDVVTHCPDFNDGNSVQIEVQIGSTRKLYQYDYNDPKDGTNAPYSWTLSGNLTLATTEAVRVRINYSNAENVGGGEGFSYIAITELA